MHAQQPNNRTPETEAFANGGVPFGTEHLIDDLAARAADQIDGRSSEIRRFFAIDTTFKSRPDSTPYNDALWNSHEAHQMLEDNTERAQYAHIASAIHEGDPESRAFLLNCLADIVRNTDPGREKDPRRKFAREQVRREVLSLSSSSLKYGQMAMDRFSTPLADRAERVFTTAFADIHKNNNGLNDFQLTRQAANDFTDQLRSSFTNLYLRHLPVFAALLSGRELIDEISLGLGAHKTTRTIDFSGDHALSNALYGLELMDATFRRMAFAGRLTTIYVANPGLNSAPSHRYELEDPLRGTSKPLHYYVRAETGEKYPGEYGNAGRVEPSVSCNVPLEAMDRRQRSVKHGVERRIGNTAISLLDFRKNPRATKRKIADIFAGLQNQSVSVRIDLDTWWNGVTEETSISLDIGSILAREGLSMPVAQLLTAGDLEMCRAIPGRVLTMNHNRQNFDQGRFGTKSAFMVIARCFENWVQRFPAKDAAGKDGAVPVIPIDEQYRNLFAQ